MEGKDKILTTDVPIPKPAPFYVSLFIHGHKLNNYIIDSKVLENIMSSSIAKALDLPITQPLGKCYSMDSKQDPLVGHIKNAQVTLPKFLEKRIV